MTQDALTEQDLRELLDSLSGEDVESCAITLKVLSSSPTGDERLLDAVRACLDDVRGCLIAIPYRYGEIRWLGAHALAAEYAARGMDRRVTVEAVMPLETAALIDAAEAAGMSGRGGVTGMLQQFDRLNAMGLLPRTTLELGPR